MEGKRAKEIQGEKKATKNSDTPRRPKSIQRKKNQTHHEKSEERGIGGETNFRPSVIGPKRSAYHHRTTEAQGMWGKGIGS